MSFAFVTTETVFARPGVPGNGGVGQVSNFPTSSNGLNSTQKVRLTHTSTKKKLGKRTDPTKVDKNHPLFGVGVSSLADLLTKPLGKIAFERLRDDLTGYLAFNKPLENIHVKMCRIKMQCVNPKNVLS